MEDQLAQGGAPSSDYDDNAAELKILSPERLRELLADTEKNMDEIESWLKHPHTIRISKELQLVRDQLVRNILNPYLANENERLRYIVMVSVLDPFLDGTDNQLRGLIEQHRNLTEKSAGQEVT